MDVLFTDTHFGWKNNSMTWLNAQLEFIYKQFIPKLKELSKTDYVRVIHLGDVFDSRSTISTYVATKVIEAFKCIRENCNEFVIICGNHDFYSPNSDEINTVSLFMSNLDITIVDKDIVVSDCNAYIPWYKWQNHEFDCIDDDILNIYTHADIINEPLNSKFNYKNVFSGHIHIPETYKIESLRTNMYNLGSCYSLNFADANSQRGFYIVDIDKVEFIPNEYSINFHRIYGKDVLKPHNFSNEDYIELYIPQDDLIKQTYIDAINEYSDYKHLWIIPVISDNHNINDIEFGKYDITTMIDELIPEELSHLYKQVKHKFNQV